MGAVPRDHFIGAIALAFFVGGVPLYLTLALNGILNLAEFTASVLAVIPALAGFALGRFVSRLIPQRAFEYLILGVLALIGLNLLRLGLL